MISITNGKGGVYKSSITANVAGLAALSGWRVLVIDTDPQANLGLDLGVGERTDNGRGLLAAVIDGTDPYVVEEIRPGLDFVPSGEAADRIATGLTMQLASGDVADAFGAFEAAFSDLAADYNLVLVDTPPGDSVLLKTVMTASRWVAVPTMPDKGSRQGIDRVARNVLASRQFNPDLDFLGVILTGLTRASTAMEAKARQRLADELEDIAPVLGSIVHDVGKAAEQCREAGMLVHEYEQAADGGARIRSGYSTGTSGLAADYQALTTELLAAFAAKEVPA